MARPLQLESFDDPAPQSDLVSLDSAAFEEARLASFEKGFSAGWEDAVAAQNTEMKRLNGELGRSLQELSFTYHEARAAMLGALRPLLLDMTSKVLPAVSRDTLGGLITDEIVALADEVCALPVTVVTHPDTLAQLRDILTEKSTLPLAFRAEPSLTEGQVFLRFDDSERQIDIDGLIARIGTAVRTYFNITEEDAAHDHS
ncbi:flagellar biosynthesis protein [Pseudothioclava arenosa]|uniref:Flagellar biosynthesis protein n=1 Tax=Pseudothioclava arenosa TaxID=1795308 RepID=A0A2A4CP95_9RHOB|nr:flagellar biosynthesis protein [Pseudothioclava arenosa]PCD75924.1 flagellar biosynthesis protein [Pseudothioclava arenosa]